MLFFWDFFAADFFALFEDADLPDFFVARLMVGMPRPSIWD